MKQLKVALSKTLCLATCIIAVATPETSFACSCYASSAAEQLERSDLAFTGYINAEPKVITSGLASHAGGLAVYTFSRLDILKGSSRPTVEIGVSNLGKNFCGYNFIPEVEYRVYANEEEGMYISDLCSIQVVPNTEDTMPIKDIMAAAKVEQRLQTSKEIKSTTDNLLQAGCSLQHQGSSLPHCFRQTDASPLICKGRFISIFSATDGSSDQQNHLYEWNRSTDELSVTGLQGFLILPDACANGMDGELRMED